MEKKNIVANASKGYGYNYASLADIASQGYPLPKMKTGTEDGRDFVYYYDTELKEWIRGAEIIVPDNKGMNKAQLYGSAVTYARRYTVMMADQLACSDDALVENLAPIEEEAVDEKQTAELRAQMFAGKKELSKKEIAWLVKHNNLVSEGDITDEMVEVLRDLQEKRRNGDGKTK